MKPPKPIKLPEGMGTEPATQDEAQKAVRLGKAAGADYVILFRETLEDGTIDDQTLMVFCPEEGAQWDTWEGMVVNGHALRCSSRGGHAL